MPQICDCKLPQASIIIPLYLSTAKVELLQFKEKPIRHQTNGALPLLTFLKTVHQFVPCSINFYELREPHRTCKKSLFRVSASI